MKPLVIVGIVLIALGIVGLLYSSISFTHDKEVAKIGDVKINAPKTETIPLTPIAGGAAVAAGVVLVIVGARKAA